MADVTLALTELAESIADEIVETGNQECTLLKLLPIKAGRGDQIKWIADGYGSSAFNFSEGGSLATYSADSQNKATLDWGRSADAKALTTTLINAASSSHAPMEALDQIAFRLKEGVKNVVSQLNTEAFTGSSSNQLVGLESAISLTGTYAGIDRSSVEGWRSFEASSVGAITVAKMRTHLHGIQKRSGRKPNLIVTSFGVLNQIMGLGDAQVQMTVNAQDAMGAIGLALGYDYVRVMGVPVVADKDCPSGTIFYLNTDAVELQYLPAANTRIGGYQLIQGNDGVDSIAMPLMLRELPSTDDAFKFVVRAECQLVVKAPHKCGVATGVTE